MVEQSVVDDLVDEIETTTPSGLRVKPGDPVASSTLRSRVTGTASQSTMVEQSVVDDLVDEIDDDHPFRSPGEAG